MESIVRLSPTSLYFVDSVLARDANFNNEVESFRSVHDLLSLTMESKLKGDVAPERLDRAGARHIECFKTVYGTDALKPKHHNSAIHIGDNARKFDHRVVDCFTQERKGGLVKTAADSIDRTSRYERTTFLRVINNELRSLSDPALWNNRLLGKTQPHPELAHWHSAAECFVSPKMTWQHHNYSADDIILVDGSTPCLVEASVCFDGRHFALMVQYGRNDKCARIQTKSA